MHVAHAQAPAGQQGARALRREEGMDHAHRRRRCRSAAAAPWACRRRRTAARLPGGCRAPPAARRPALRKRESGSDTAATKTRRPGTGRPSVARRASASVGGEGLARQCPFDWQGEMRLSTQKTNETEKGCRMGYLGRGTKQQTFPASSKRTWHASLRCARRRLRALCTRDLAPARLRPLCRA